MPHFSMPRAFTSSRVCCRGCGAGRQGQRHRSAENGCSLHSPSFLLLRPPESGRGLFGPLVRARADPRATFVGRSRNVKPSCGSAARPKVQTAALLTTLADLPSISEISASSGREQSDEGGGLERRRRAGAPPPLPPRRPGPTARPARPRRCAKSPMPRPAPSAPRGDGETEDERARKRDEFVERRKARSRSPPPPRRSSAARLAGSLRMIHHARHRGQRRAEAAGRPVEPGVPGRRLPRGERRGIGGAVAEQVGIAVGGDGVDHRRALARPPGRSRSWRRG